MSQAATMSPDTPPADPTSAPEATSTAARPPRRTPVTWVRRGGLTTLLFALPMLIVFGVFSWSPIVQAVVMSFQRTNLVTEPQWVGIANFAAVLQDPLFYTALRNTALFAGIALLIGYPIPLVVAVLMSEFRRSKGWYSVLAYLPVVIPPVVSVLLWKVFYDASPNGVFNTMLSWFGIPAQPWIQSAATAMPSLVLQATWAGAGGTIIIYLAALTSVAPELYDAAEVDGASIWQKVWHVTLPQLRGILFITLILQIIATAQVFLQPFLFTGGGPANSTTTILLLIYQYAFTNSLGGAYGKATALSLMLALFLGLMSLGYFRLTKKWSD
ncbi:MULTISPECIES: carbohydrate ABC transporter permease [unclassified Microbacterium]|uniref:carbohydrate ABC transporter permease n=1 Tax=unclassified Microbacterium TaxID=2609290 RepID=UPI003651BCD6